MKDIYGKEKSVTAGALLFAFDSLFTRGLTSLGLFLLALAVTGLNLLIKHIFTMLMIARYGHSGDSISLFPPFMTYQYLMRNDTYVDMEPAFLTLFYVTAFLWCCFLITALHRILLNYYATGTITLRPFISVHQIVSIATLLAIPFALQIPEVYNYLPQFLKTHSDAIEIILFIGLIVGSRFILAGYFIIDQGKNPVQAMRDSWQATVRHDELTDNAWSLTIAILIILQLALVINPFDPYKLVFPPIHYIAPFAPTIKAWLHWLMIGLTTVYAYRKLEKK